MDLRRRRFVQVREKCLLWENRPTWEWRSLLHWMHLWMVSSCVDNLWLLFWRLRLSSAACLSWASPRRRPARNFCLHLSRSHASVSHLPVSMSSDFIIRLHTSLKRRWGHPCARLSEASSPYNKSFGILPSGVR